uniref:Uncharacterized protein n=1 Tax=Hordeum vulgare subsp. vulgare TaxID=112509 RepID=A0A8I6Y3P5_HORVV
MCPVRHAAVKIRSDHHQLAGFDWRFDILYSFLIVLKCKMVIWGVAYPAIGILSELYDGSYAQHS